VPWLLLIGAVVHSYVAAGVQASGPGAGIVVGDSAITGNGTGVSQTNSAAIASCKNNVIDANGIDGTRLRPVGLN
jgi:hypothetical protein